MAGNGDFDWHGDDADSVVVPEQPMTAVYATTGGQVVLRQQAAGGYQDEDTLAYFNPQGAMAAAWAMIEQAHLIGLPAPSSAQSADGARAAGKAPLKVVHEAAE